MNNPLAKIIICFAICNGFLLKSHAQTIIIGTKNTSLIYKVDRNHQLQQAWFGAKLDASSETDSLDYKALPSYGNPGFPGGGMGYVFEPAIEVVHSDGNPSLLLDFIGSSVEKENDDVSVTHIKLKDPVYPFYVTLNFKSYQKENIIEEWATIQHEEKSAVTLNRYASSFVTLHDNNFYLTHFYGDWASEMQFEETKLPEGIYNIQSKLGTRATNYEVPSFMISPNKPAAENEGDVFAGSLAWSGNFNLQFENIRSNGHAGNSLKIIPGINAYASAYSLKPKELFNTPHFIFTWSTNGKGQASRNLHEWALNYGVWK